MQPASPPADLFERPILTIDIVVLTLCGGRLMVAAYERDHEPFKGRNALLGGYVHVDTDANAEASVARVLAEKAALGDIYVEQLRTFSGRERDPRGWSASIAYVALLPRERLDTAKRPAELLPVDAVHDLAFDHAEIVKAAVDRMRTKGAYSTLPARLLPATFTLPEMQQVYEAVIGESLDQSSFRRKIAELGAVVPMVGEMRQTATVRRPAQLYRLAEPIALFDRKL